MTDREIVRDAIVALDAFAYAIAGADDVVTLLSMWTRRDELSATDIRQVVDYYRSSPAPAEAAERASLAAPPILSERDGAPGGAVRGVDNDGDTWPRVGTRWQMDGLAPRTTQRLVRSFGPIHWYDADGEHIATSRVGGA